MILAMQSYKRPNQTGSMPCAKRQKLAGNHTSGSSNETTTMSLPKPAPKKRATNPLKSGDLRTVIEYERQQVTKNVAREELILRRQLDELQTELLNINELDILISRKQKCILEQTKQVKQQLEYNQSDDKMIQFNQLCANYIAVYEDQKAKPVGPRAAIPISKESANRLSKLGCVLQQPREISNSRGRPINDAVLIAIVEDFIAACRGEPHLGAIECVKHANMTSLQNSAQTMSSTNDSADICPSCRVPVLLVTPTSTLVCPSCGRSETYIDTSSLASSFAKDNDGTSPYKRINHLNDNLMCFQAKEPKLVPKSVITLVMERLFIEGYVEIAQITHMRLRTTLKSLGFRRYYDNIPQIHERITSIKPPQMTPAQEDRVRHRFLAAQAPFERHCPAARKNFLSYPYTIYKICEIEGWTELLPCFRLPKGRDKRRQADCVWYKVCNDLDGKDPTMPWTYKETPPPPPNIR